MKNTYLNRISTELNVSVEQVKVVVSLFDGGATIPFISRYRKEVTGGLDEVKIQEIFLLNNKYLELHKRKDTIIKTISEQGKLTDELLFKINNIFDSNELEDLYLPYKPKRRTKGTIAKELGLEPLAKKIIQQHSLDLNELAKEYLTSLVDSIEMALQGARDIIAEWISENQITRKKMRYLFQHESYIFSSVVKGKDVAGEKFKDYFDFYESIKKCPSHRILAIRRGENEGFLKVSIYPDGDDAVAILENYFVKGFSPSAEQVKIAIRDSYKRLIQPSLENEFKKLSKEKADEEAIKVFSNNLRQLLLASPLGQKRILAIDPGFRTGCKIVCLNENGDLLYNNAIYPNAPQNDQANAMQLILHLVDKYKIEAIAIGNGTAGRETETFIRSIKFSEPVQIFMVNESGASVYSASEIAREEFPKHDITVRGSVSIGRRLMDPLAELVKIDAKSIGVGQYQHDVDQSKLKENLDFVVESCVNSVGVNLNTASKHLLSYVSGLGPKLAQNIIEYRSENGKFETRTKLKEVPRMGAKAFEQAAGFLRIQQGKNILDSTAVHPESYKIVQLMAKDVNVSVAELIKNKELHSQININKYVSEKIGLPTLKDILKELDKPGIDPREKIKSFEFAEGVNKIEDLYEGMILPGIVTNITNFGAFVDIGVHQDGLVHISHLSNKYVSNPQDVVKLSQQVVVKVIGLEAQRKRIQLSMKDI
ncbi:MAG: RNA-binding transcriptional accessory protein [Salinivirgaceae bacterium]|nr:RNA-binding transcriptional accessory protein [Salinivirgaceae bacterium]